MKASVFYKSALALTLALVVPMLASAESQLVVGSGSAAARLDFRVVIPRVLFLGLGAEAAGLATNTTIDTVTFDHTTNPVDVGTGGAADAITDNVVPVRVLGNHGRVTYTASMP